ncbi:MAG: heme ABC exporter ATP-binding protein CcmA [Deltaproteobacteria bacterium]|nr:heme ABC exporter ATP-binding protein CcmA [Deltaproteobacteria bacterium]
MTLSIDGVSKSYGPGVVALRPFTLEAKAGETVVLTGANGSGKTTLLRIIAGLARPSSGSIRFGGFDTRDLGRAFGRRVAYLGHDPALYRELTARENVDLAVALKGEVNRGAADALTAVALDPDDTRPVGAYSRGMKQRVAWARILATNAEVALLDEPFTALDHASTARVLTALGDWLRARSRITFIATHALEPVSALGARFVELQGFGGPS